MIFSDYSMSLQSTRASTEKYLVGQPESEFPFGHLPTHKDVIREVLFKRDQSSSHNTPLATLVSCKMQTGTESNTSVCHELDGCAGNLSKCTLYKVKLMWSQAGIKTIADKFIREKIVNLMMEYKDMFKKRERVSQSAVDKREQFTRKLESCFDVSSSDAITDIRLDKKRTEEDKEHDIRFLEDQLTERRMRFTSVDNRYASSVSSAIERKV